MTLLLGIDLETTGLDSETDQITEIGAVLWDVEKKMPVEIYSDLVQVDCIDITEEITKLTGITNELVEKHGCGAEASLGKLSLMMQDADFCCAHNAPFDMGFLRSYFKAFPETIPPGKIDWIDTKTDIPYVDGMGKGSLTLIAANHGFLNPFAHRALFDVMTMLKVLSQYDFSTIVARSKSPTIVMQAVVSFQEKDLAKAEGFYWKPETKQWLREFKQCDLDGLTFGFKTNILGEKID